MAPPWRLSGDYVEACNCDVACPCVFLSDPTGGKCTALIGWHVRQGKIGDVPFNNLNFALAAYSPGNMSKSKWEVAVYVDERASPEQRGAIQPILSGQAGGLFGVLGPFIGKVVGMSFARMEFRAEGKHRSFSIHGAGSLSSTAIDGSNGAETKLAGAPLLLAPEVTVARNEKVDFHDHGWKWSIEGKNSFYAPFEMTGP